MADLLYRLGSLDLITGRDVIEPFVGDVPVPDSGRPVDA
jgi:hypothetical protein